jgi:hypothetical protein
MSWLGFLHILVLIIIIKIWLFIEIALGRSLSWKALFRIGLLLPEREPTEKPFRSLFVDALLWKCGRHNRWLGTVADFMSPSGTGKDLGHSLQLLGICFLRGAVARNLLFAWGA